MPTSIASESRVGIRDGLRRAWTYLRLFWVLRRLRARHQAEEQLRARVALAELLAEAKGLAMKAGQIAASRIEPGQNADREPLVALVSGIEPRPLEEMKPVIEARLGGRLDLFFGRIFEAGMAASIGQVHRAELKTGAAVAVKVRYPGIRRAVAAELALLRRLPSAGPIGRFGFDRQAYDALFASLLAQELDYLGEAVRQERFRARCCVRPGLVVPQVVPELCRRGILVQSFEPGASLEEAATWESPVRAQLARCLLETLLYSLFEQGFVHADPNPGNIGFRRGGARPQVVLYDFGCMLEPSEQRRLALLRLLLELRGAAAAEMGPQSEGDAPQPGSMADTSNRGRAEPACDLLPWFVALGFDGEKLLPIAAELPAVAGLLFQPFLVDRRFALDRWRLGERLGSLLGDLRWWFRSAGPADSLLLMRIFGGLFSQLTRLAVDLPWWRVLERVVSLRTRERALALDPPDCSHLWARTVPTGRRAARLLRLEVSEQDRSVMAMALPAVEVLALEELLPTAARQKLAEAGVDLRQLAESACRGGFVPGSLVDAEIEGKRYRLWLEAGGKEPQSG